MTDKIEKSKERLAESGHTPDLVQAFAEDNDELHQVLRPAKPLTYMATFIGLYLIAKQAIVKIRCIPIDNTALKNPPNIFRH